MSAISTNAAAPEAACSEQPLWPPVEDGSAEQAEGYRALIDWMFWFNERLVRQGKPSPIQQTAERRRQQAQRAA